MAKENRMKLSSVKEDYPRNACKNDTGLEHFFTKTKKYFPKDFVLRESVVSI